MCGTRAPGVKTKSPQRHGQEARFTPLAERGVWPVYLRADRRAEHGPAGSLGNLHIAKHGEPISCTDGLQLKSPSYGQMNIREGEER